MRRRNLILSFTALGVATVSLVPVLANNTSLGALFIDTDRLSTDKVEGRPGTNLRVEATSLFDANGAELTLQAAPGQLALFGPTVPRSGGQLNISAGQGSANQNDIDGGSGGNLVLSGGGAGTQVVPTTGAPGDGGDVIVRPGFGGAGGGAPGVIRLQSGISSIDRVIVDDSGLHVLGSTLALPLENVLDTCDGSRTGYLSVRFQGGGIPDALCVCLDTGSGTFQWVNLNGAGSCT